MPETPVISVARRVPRLRVRFFPGQERTSAAPSLPREPAGLEPAPVLHSDIPSLEYWLDINA
jgi:hypothetical protein